MDHLFLPADASLTEDDIVPCVAERDYIGVSFQEYPLRKGFPHLLPGHRSHSFSMREALNPTPRAQLERFIQTWAWFGVLQELLGESFCHDDFVCTRQLKGRSVQALSTVKLAELVKKESLRERSASEKATLSERLAHCFRLALQVRMVFDQIDRKIALAIEVLLDTFPSPSGVVSTVTFAELIHPLDYGENVWISQMVENGWCVNEAENASEQFKHASMMFFMGKLKQKQTNRDHSGCVKSHCSALQISPATYRSKHRYPDCTCEMLAVDSASLNRILQDGEVPLLDFVIDQSTHELGVEFVASPGGIPYVAISHVWADGLGNPHANALPKCQLADLRGLANAIMNKIDRNDQESGLTTPLIWLDTLCCPAQAGSGKDAAMAMMRKIYAEASHVIVLDESLRRYAKAEMPFLEAAFRIFTASWNRRLWCLQEGALPQMLWFQFSDGAIEVREIYDQVVSLVTSDDFRTKTFALEIGGCWMTLRSFFHTTTKAKFLMAKGALKRRSVSVASDEPICLATLFDMDAGPIIKERQSSQRMAKFWTMLCQQNEVPSDIIFEEAPKLDIPGFRWAPSSLLNCKRLGAPGPYTAKAQLTDAGLVVRFRGVETSVPRMEGYDVQPLFEASEAAKALWLRDAHSNRWYGVEVSKLPSDSESGAENLTQTSVFDFVQKQKATFIYGSEAQDQIQTWSMLSEQEHFRDVSLVDIKEIRDGCRLVNILSPTSMVRVDATTCVMMDALLEIANLVRMHEVTLAFGQEQKLHRNALEAEKSDSYLAARRALSTLLNATVEELAHERTMHRVLCDRWGSLADGISALSHTAWILYFGYYLVVDQWLSQDTLWCFD